MRIDKNFRHGNGEIWLLGGSVGGLAGGSMIVGLVLVCLRSFSRIVGNIGAAIGRRWRVCPDGFCFNSGGGDDAEIPQGRDESFISIELYIIISPSPLLDSYHERPAE